MSLEHELKRALRAQDPGEAFTARVLARVKADAIAHANGDGHGIADAVANNRANADGEDAETRAPGRMVTFPIAAGSRTTPRSGSRRAWAAALAATLLLTAGGTQWVRYRQEMAEGARARAEVLAALRLTSAKLSIVRAAVADSETAH
jgi:hypothetical protein